MTLRFDGSCYAELNHAYHPASGLRQFLSAVLVVACACIFAPLLSTVMASEITVGSRFDPNEDGFHELVVPCLDCHAIDHNSTDLVGPSLKGVFGRRIADLGNYDYSAALYRKAAFGGLWDEVKLDQFLEAPQTMAPGNAMTYAGVPDARDRARLITWLATGPVPLDAEALADAARKPSPEVNAILQINADAKYGEYLAGKCLTCHSSPGASGSIPPISGLPADYFIKALLDYQQGKRPNPIMLSMSDLLGAEELAALASFFAQPVP